MGEMAVTIRSAVEADAESVFQLIQALGYRNLDREDFKRNFAETLHHQDSLIYLAEDTGGRVLGLMTLSHRPQLRLGGRIVSIDELVVVEGARGSGVGGALLEKAKSFATALQSPRLELHTKRTRESYRRRFYIKNGFVEANSAVMRLEKDFRNE
jgi:ribosomal protein S18 acetylase RimI-like enzyme